MFAKAQPTSASVVGQSFTYSVASDSQVADENGVSATEPQRDRGELEPITFKQIAIAALYIGAVASFGGLVVSRLVKSPPSDAVWPVATAIIATLGGVAAIPILRTVSRGRGRS